MDRREIEVSGVVQGVGFRPFVHGLATRLGLHGSVRNQTGGVVIELEGDPHSLDRFLSEMTARPPALARIAGVKWVNALPRGDPGFRIEPSEAGRDGPVFVAPDAATCGDCLRELFDPADRRFRYPFLNCTNCGPRLTIVRGAPYDRERTTMAGFAMCPTCRSEYDDPGDRRYHAQPVACPACGPRLRALDAAGREVAGVDPLAFALGALGAGKVVALKGLGGYHLACDARDGDAVARLRRRKHRDEKPFAVMVAGPGAARDLCALSGAERAVLTSPRRPIVLLARRPGGGVAPGVAPGNPSLGVMLPYTPLHHLLLEDLGAGAALVMTSGNRSDEPIAYEDADAVDRLSGVADVFLAHDRPIHVRCDDSVTRVVAGVELPLRRSRGEAPQPVALPRPCLRPTLAVGGQMKSVFALGRGRHAFLSHHLGDLDHYAAYRAFVAAVEHYERLFGVKPERLVHDLHPDYASTRYALGRADLPRLAVQHHHAHAASVMADNGLDGPVIAVTFDGTGYGTDGAVWGGEFLTGGYRGFRRAAHLRYVAMPGGERAVREPWRMALSHLADAGRGDGPLHGRVAAPALGVARRMVERGFNAPMTSSAGRLFDAVAALAGVRDYASYEGQAAMELEWRASGVAVDGCYPFGVDAPADPLGPLVVDTRPLIAAAAADADRGLGAGLVARRFHSTVVEVIATVCGRLRAATGLDVVALSGGVFLNALLSVEAADRLRRDGFRVYQHRRVPPGDGGLCLGQLAIAAASDEGGYEGEAGGRRFSPGRGPQDEG